MCVRYGDEYEVHNTQEDWFVELTYGHTIIPIVDVKPRHNHVNTALDVHSVGVVRRPFIILVAIPELWGCRGVNGEIMDSNTNTVGSSNGTVNEWSVP